VLRCAILDVAKNIANVETHPRRKWHAPHLRCRQSSMFPSWHSSNKKPRWKKLEIELAGLRARAEPLSSPPLRLPTLLFLDAKSKPPALSPRKPIPADDKVRTKAGGRRVATCGCDARTATPMPLSARCRRRSPMPSRRSRQSAARRPSAKRPVERASARQLDDCRAGCCRIIWRRLATWLVALEAIHFHYESNEMGALHWQHHGAGRGGCRALRLPSCGAWAKLDP